MFQIKLYVVPKNKEHPLYLPSIKQYTLWDKHLAKAYLKLSYYKFFEPTDGYNNDDFKIINDEVLDFVLFHVLDEYHCYQNSDYALPRPISELFEYFRAKYQNYDWKFRSKDLIIYR